MSALLECHFESYLKIYGCKKVKVFWINKEELNKNLIKDKKNTFLLFLKNGELKVIQIIPKNEKK